MCRLLLFVFSVSFLQSAVFCQRYVVPDAKVELLSPKGLKISIPADDAGITLVAFHVNINSEFYGLEHGHWAQDIIKKRDNRWTYVIPDLQAKKGDTIYYWIYVVVDGLAYHGLDRMYKVTESTVFTPVTQRPPTPKPVETISADRENPSPVCRPSLSSRNGGRSACSAEVILEETFSNVNKWSHVVQIGGSQPEDEFTVFTNEPTVFSLKDGNLFIKPILLEDIHGEDFVLVGNYVLDHCTSNIPEECSKQAKSFLIQPPVMSARLTTKGKFSFRYGTVVIRAKLPKGDWIVPELWLEPVSQEYGSHAGRVVLGLSRGNTDFTVADVSNWLLEAGVWVDQNSRLGKKTSDTRWSQDYHTFKLVWGLDEMVFYVDDEQVARLPSGEGPLDPSLNKGRLAPFDKEFYITLGVHVAGSRDFPTEVRNKPWKNSDPKRLVSFWQARSTWRSTWDQDSTLQIESVKVTALD